jgi:hypothetical protein
VRWVDECFGDGPLLTPQTIHARMVCERRVDAINSDLYDTMIRR